MKYLCLVFIDEKQLEALTPAESQSLDDESLASDDQFRERGYLLAAQALEPVRSAATVRVRNGRPIITDGPFTETREQVGGFVLLEARDIDQAKALAAEIPVARMGAIEIRPVKELVRSPAQ